MKGIAAALILFLSGLPASAQVGVNTNSPDPSSALDVQSTNKGMLVPRMDSATRVSIGSPATGLLVYQTNGNSGFYFFNGSSWKSLSSDVPVDVVTGTGTTDFLSKWTGSSVLGNSLFRDNGTYGSIGGSLGVGTTLPGIFAGASRYLSISAGNAYGANPVALELQGANTSTLIPFAQIDFASYGTAADDAARIDARRGGATSMGTLVFSTNDGTALTERMRIKDAGNVGINTGNSSISANAFLAIKDGHIQIQQTALPTATALAGAGTSASANVTTINPKSTDVCGRVTIITGTGAVSTGGYVTVSFIKPFASNPVVLITPANANAGSAQTLYGNYVTSTTTGFTINFASPAVTGTVFAFNYVVIETQ